GAAQPPAATRSLAKPGAAAQPASAPHDPGLSFDDVTSVQKSPELEAAAREKLETLPGAAAPQGDGAMFPSSAVDSPHDSNVPPASADGSVTFDLADLEASEDEITHEFSD